MKMVELQKHLENFWRAPFQAPIWGCFYEKSGLAVLLNPLLYCICARSVPRFVIRLGLEPRTPTLKVLCSTN